MLSMPPKIQSRSNYVILASPRDSLHQLRANLEGSSPCRLQACLKRKVSIWIKLNKHKPLEPFPGWPLSSSRTKYSRRNQTFTPLASSFMKFSVAANNQTPMEKCKAFKSCSRLRTTTSALK